MKFHHVAVSAKNLEIATKFYIDNFGFKKVREFERPDLSAKAAWLELDGNYIEFWQFKDQIDRKDDFFNLGILGYKHIGLKVDDVQKAYEDLKEKGLDVSEPKQGTVAKYIFVKDPDGLPVELLEFSEN